MTTTPSSPRQPQSFTLGQILCTPGVLQAATQHPQLMTESISRHAQGDWGCVCPEDAETNNEAVRDGFRILSAYPIDPALPCKGYGENCIWVITEADRSVTTLPNQKHSAERYGHHGGIRPGVLRCRCASFGVGC